MNYHVWGNIGFCYYSVSFSTPAIFCNWIFLLWAIPKTGKSHIVVIAQTNHSKMIDIPVTLELDIWELICFYEYRNKMIFYGPSPFESVFGRVYTRCNGMEIGNDTIMCDKSSVKYEILYALTFKCFVMNGPTLSFHLQCNNAAGKKVHPKRGWKSIPRTLHCANAH